MKIFASIMLAAVLLTSCVDSAKILGLFHFSGQSHFVMFQALFKELASRGHQVTMVSHWPQKNPIANFTDISVAGSMPTHLNNFTMDFVHSLNLQGVLTFIWPHNLDLCRDALEQPQIQKLINSDEHYDLIITEMFGVDCFLGLAHKKKLPFILMSSSVLVPWANARLGNPDNPSYLPNLFLPYTDHMSFVERMWNTVYYLATNIGSIYFNEQPMQQLARKHFGSDLPPLNEIAKNTSLILVNSHFSLTPPRPMVPAMIEVAGMHVPTPKKLPQELEKFLTESPEGVVYFSMGSLIRSDSFSPDRLRALIDAFAQLKTRVLWKINPETLPELPSNVKVMRWVPQTDVLSHPKVRAFVTHGGLMGTQEAVYAGVPLVGIPFFGDQQLNIGKYVSEKVAVKLDYKDITTQTALAAINTVLNDKSYKQNAERLSRLFKDRPHTPMETAVFWTEYVIRHGGATHMRSSAANMPLYQYLLLDVIGTLLLVTTFIFIALWVLIKFMLSIKRRIAGKQNDKKQGDSNKKNK